MGHYDSCRDETWAPKKVKCTGKLIKSGSKKEKEFDGEHNWKETSYGVQTCTNCGHTIFYT